jgi:glycosyltransferase involved in cell wall biosynthesis
MSLPPLRIAQVVPPLEAVPPPGYGGTERVVAELIRELHRRGHELTLFASGDSHTEARLVPTIQRHLRAVGMVGEMGPYVLATQLAVLREAASFDLIHAHLEYAGLLLARATNVPVVTTFHGLINQPWGATLLVDAPPGLVAISRSQASAQPGVAWEIVHNGLSLAAAPFVERPGDGLCFVGRFAADKGVVEAIEIARRVGRPLRIAAKAPVLPAEHAYFDSEYLPAARTADVEYLGELSGPGRDALIAESFATLMPGSWAEPFGLVAIESLGCGTPVVARRAGALPEIVRDGIDGIVGDNVAELARRLPEVARLDRAAIRADVLERFSAERMVDGYEAVYARRLGLPPPVEATRRVSAG